MTTIHDFQATTIDGQPVSLGDYAGKVLLLVNVASECGLTPQYAGLQALHERYADRGFAVLGFPCNQFGAQEPGSDAQIQEFCSTRFGVSFPLFSKIEVNGAGAHPLYAHLTALEVGPEGAGDVKWNFGKFLIGKDGEVLARFAPPTDPQDEAVTGAIEAALG